MKKLYAYLIKYNHKSNNPSYDLRFFENETEVLKMNHDNYTWIKADHLDTIINIVKCECCGKTK